MIPGQEPYTEAERSALSDLIGDAGEAEEIFSLDELEAAAEAQRSEAEE